jgi:hypothetical protein
MECELSKTLSTNDKSTITSAGVADFVVVEEDESDSNHFNESSIESRTGDGVLCGKSDLALCSMKKHFHSF